MKKVKGEILGVKLFGLSAEENLANFINDNNIRREDIIQIVYNPLVDGYAIFYFAED